MTEYCDDCSYCDEHGWWSAERMPCPTCDVLANMRAELRWCDAERRLALRALAEYAPACDVCNVRAVVEVHLAVEVPNEFKCERHRPHWKTCTPLDHAAQIAAADEESER